jgi:hypothetical protein
VRCARLWAGLTATQQAQTYLARGFPRWVLHTWISWGQINAWPQQGNFCANPSAWAHAVPPFMGRSSIV